MHTGCRLTALAQRREQLQERIRAQRRAAAVVAARILTPLRLIDLGVRVQRLFRAPAD